MCSESEPETSGCGFFIVNKDFFIVYCEDVILFLNTKEKKVEVLIIWVC